MTVESVDRIEPARLEELPEALSDRVADLASATAALGHALHPRTAASLADLVRIMNTYYSNLIEGHNTKPRDIERALVGDLEQDEARRNLQIEAAAHVRVQAEIDRASAEGRLDSPASRDFIRRLHREFYRDLPEAFLRVEGAGHSFLMRPGEWRSLPGHDVTVGRHVPPSSHRVEAFMQHFESRYRFDRMGRSGQIISMAAAHHRFNYIHPFPDGNGRVSRLMSHTMAAAAGIGAHGLWSISRGLARGLESRGEYKRMMDHADMPRQDDRDGRGNLSERALIDFVSWFLVVCLDQVRFMSSLFELPRLKDRVNLYVARDGHLRPEAGRLLEEALFRGQFDRGDVSRITGLPERSARRVLTDTLAEGLLGSDSPRGPVSLRFPQKSLEVLFPRLFPVQ